MDARAVALVAWRAAGKVPAATADDETGVVDLLVTERAGIDTAATRRRNQLHQLLLQLDPDYRTPIPRPTSQQGLRAVASSATDDARDRAAQIRALAATRRSPPATIGGGDLRTAGARAGLY